MTFQPDDTRNLIQHMGYKIFHFPIAGGHCMDMQMAFSGHPVNLRHRLILSQLAHNGFHGFQ